MTSVSLPNPVVRRPGPPLADAGALERDLRQAVDGEVRFDAGSRGAYSTDASNCRQVPIGVVVPRTVDAAVRAIAVCREHGAPVVSRRLLFEMLEGHADCHCRAPRPPAKDLTGAARLPHASVPTPRARSRSLHMRRRLTSWFPADCAFMSEPGSGQVVREYTISQPSAR